MMKEMLFEELKKINGGSLCGWPNGWDVATEKKPVSRPVAGERRAVGWPNGWDVAEVGPLGTCDPPC